jgi:choline-sulfatase
VYDAGFHPPERGQNRFTSVERPAAQVAARATNWLARNSQGPFFLWLQLNDPEDASGAAYNAAIAAEDAAVGKLVAALQADKLYEDSLIVIAADHGQSLGAHGEDSHGIFLYDETAHVPLLVKLPQNQSAGKRVRARASLIDIAPTLLGVAGVAIQSLMQGQSLLRIATASPNADRPAYSASKLPQRAFGWSAIESWRAGKYLYIKAPRPELYDLSSDPGAAHNLAQSSKATLETIAAQLDAFDRRFSGPGAAATDLTSSEMQKLASLGYVGLQKSAAPASVASGGVDPKDAIAIANTALSAQRSLDDGKPEKAIALLQPVMTAASKMYLAQYVMGIALAQQGQYPQAIERLHSAIELM